MKFMKPAGGLFATLLATSAVWHGPLAAETIDPFRLQALEWRNIGPHRGGRVTAVDGVPSQPFTFYMGATGGGVWRTTDGGVSWFNLSDGYFKTGSVGAIAVAPSNPDIIYVGMGEHCVRAETFSHGDGVYKSEDGGRTWTHMGLTPTKQIASVIVHPTNPDIVYVGAQGSPWGPHPERGVYKSVDGGRTWTHILKDSPSTGVNDLVMDPNNPDVLYAAMWEHVQKPWHGYQITSGGPGSALYKSIDGGATWARLGGGLPEPAGKYAITASPADSNRLFALAEARPGEGGLFRSDDAGASWVQVNDAHVMTERSPYYMHVVADTKDRDTVYVLHAPFLKSTDGGKTFTSIPTGHSDSHDLWIHPENPNWMIEANDGGANITYNGGRTWSTQGNQPTAQFYRVTADNLFPYNLYGGQQDNTTVKIASRTFDRGIGVRDWYPIGGGESAHVAFDPGNPVLVYAGNYQGQITEFDVRTREERNVQRYPLQTAYRPGDQYPFRFNWNAPVIVSQHNPEAIYHGAHVVLKSTDRGQSWQEISPDLTRDEPQKQGIVEGEFTTDGTAGSMYNTIFYIADSPHAAGELWVGTDDGRLHLTRNDGQSWDEITPPNLGETQVNMIEVSPHHSGKAYVVTTAYRFNDFTPNILVTEDYGRTWTRKVNGIADNDFIRVVREDPERQGLLFAGSETAMYVSFDDGVEWQPMQLNLPRVPITDLRVHSGDLIAATQGRAFWILDDISPLRQLDAKERREVRLFRPAAAEQVRISRGRGGAGENPPTGTLIYYELPPGPEAGDIRMDILNGAGEVVNSYTAHTGGPREEHLVSWYRPDTPRPSLTTTAGLNRFVWDWQVRELRDYEALKGYRGPRSYRLPPGAYYARLTVNGRQMTQPFQVLSDPRKRISPQAQSEKQALLQTIHSEADALLKAVDVMKAARADVQRHLAADPGSPALKVAGAAVTQRITEWLNATIEEGNRFFVDSGHSPGRLDFNLLAVLAMVDNMDAPITSGLLDRVGDVREEWARRRAEYQVIVGTELPAFRRLTASRG